MIFFIWLFNIISTVLLPIGIISFLMFIGEVNIIIPAVIGVLGFIFGLKAWEYDVPPRWFWAKSRNEIFDSKVKTVIAYTLSFFFCTYGVYGIIVFFSMI